MGSEMCIRDRWSQTVSEPVDRPITRQAWTPPPPPNEPQQIEPPPPIASDQIGQSSGGLSETGGGSQPAIPSLSAIEVSNSDNFIVRKQSHVVPIAVALAIAVPISLVVGAMIGVILMSLGKG